MEQNEPSPSERAKRRNQNKHLISKEKVSEQDRKYYETRKKRAKEKSEDEKLNDE